MELPDFSKEEMKAITELRNRVEKESVHQCAILDDDLVLYKFLKARSFNLDEASHMLKKHINWRLENQVDRILLDYKPLEVLQLYFSQNFLGFDKEGCPIRYNATGNIDLDGIVKSATFRDVMKCVIHVIETDIARTREQSKKLEKTVSQFIYIYNLENLTLAKAFNKINLDSFMLGTLIFQDNYPERLKKIYVINAPIYFTLTFTILKTVLANELVKKVQVFGQSGWKEKLLEDIDKNVLPAFLGGTRTDPDGNPLCNTFMDHGGPIPKKYFFINYKPDFENSEDVQKKIIRKKSQIGIDIDVEKVGTIIQWEFKSKSRDIGFGLSLQLKLQENSEIKSLIPVHRIETPMYPESGMHYCEYPGKYIIIFDNSYSWWTAKELFYKIVVCVKE